ncbi:hypothetical protein AYK24_10255 [Thermoplasmatales archaeon SG8-52-4]|nr:MAG: hypothetical protein AYK24_10255 [Thermoplasmatales archaeon SG8-52-4]
MTPNIFKKCLAFGFLLVILLSSFSSVVCSLGNSKYFYRKYVEYEDDIPPTVEVIYPESGFYYITLFGFNFKIPIPFDIAYINGLVDPIYIVVNATDNIGVESVTFYIDDEIRDVDYEYPYIWLWEEYSMMIFFYKLKATARDFAGNEASDMIIVWRAQLHPTDNMF